MFSYTIVDHQERCWSCDAKLFAMATVTRYASNFGLFFTKVILVEEILLRNISTIPVGTNPVSLKLMFRQCILNYTKTVLWEA